MAKIKKIVHVHVRHAGKPTPVTVTLNTDGKSFLRAITMIAERAARGCTHSATALCGAIRAKAAIELEDKLILKTIVRGSDKCSRPRCKKTKGPGEGFYKWISDCDKGIGYHYCCPRCARLHKAARKRTGK
jgi:hypothetical protein